MLTVDTNRAPVIYPLAKYGYHYRGGSPLERVADPVTEFDAALAWLVDDLFATMYAARGVGLAAPQIAIGKRVAVIDISEDHSMRTVLINPEIVESRGAWNTSEGCLSVPGVYEQVKRADYVRVRTQRADNGEWTEIEGEGLLARAIQHEVDHLNGSLFLNRISSLKRGLIERKIKNLARKGRW